MNSQIILLHIQTINPLYSWNDMSATNVWIYLSFFYKWFDENLKKVI